MVIPSDLKKWLKMRMPKCVYSKAILVYVEALVGEVGSKIAEIVKFENRIQQLESAQPKWISVEERLPEGFATVILYGDVRGITVGFYDVDDRYFWRSEGNGTLRSVNATHWMPLPPEPEVK